MLKVAITGNIASGKSLVEKYLKEKFQVLDTDAIAHDLLKQENIKKRIIIDLFGMDILEDGQISRPKLGKIAFKNPAVKKKIEQILHPKIKNEVEQFLRQQEAKCEKIAIVSVPLLYEAGFVDLFDTVILVCADEATRLERLMRRNNLSLEDAKNRLKNQISQDEKISLADYVIYNDKTIEDLSVEVGKLIDYLHKNSTLPESK